jgi:hypothetical protein
MAAGRIFVVSLEIIRRTSVAAMLMMSAPAAQAQDMIKLRLTFDDETRLTLARIGERVTVNAWFFGEPTAAGKAFVDEMDEVYLGTETYDIRPVDQTLILGGSMGGMPADLVVDPMINVNVFTSRIKDENNLIQCGIIQGPTRDLSAAPQSIACVMLGG